MNLPLTCIIGGTLGVAAAGNRIVDAGLKPLGFGLISAGLLALASPAFADQHLIAADNARVDCTASSSELTRISLIGDAFASVSKISTGYPYSDFTVTNEPIRGDIYISVPQGYAPRSINFFATSKQGLCLQVRLRRRARRAAAGVRIEPGARGTRSGDLGTGNTHRGQRRSPDRSHGG